jgi:uncharacterized protein (DUF1810 family)
MADNLTRFVEAQEGIYPQALAELRAGWKRSHWMWFIFPQVAGLGHSAMAQRYALADLAEARAYLAHPVLGQRLIECTKAMLGWAGKRDAVAILGQIDALKFASCMTLFEAAGGSEVFAMAFDAFYVGDRDTRTLALLG